jgi:hypothetical protein
VTEGGLPYTDVRDLAALVAAIFAGRVAERRVMAPSFFLTHADHRALLARLSGQAIAAQALPGFVLRGLGRLGDLVQRFRPQMGLTYEAAEVLTRSVPLDDRIARAALGREAIPAEVSFRDLIDWMVTAGHLTPAEAGHA